jgi:hypothetical protein
VLSVFQSLVASFIYGVLCALFGAMILYWRYRAVYKLWNLKLSAIRNQAVFIGMSSRVDERDRPRPSSSEMYACFDIKEFFTHMLQRYISRIQILRPELSVKIKSNASFPRVALFLGGPNHNHRSDQFMKALKAHGLTWQIERKSGGDVFALVNTASPQVRHESTYGLPNDKVDSFKTYTDYGLIIRCKHPMDSTSTLLLVAGTHGAGTRAAANAIIDPEMCQKILKGTAGNPSFGAVISVDVVDLKHGPPVLVSWFGLSSISALSGEELKALMELKTNPLP